MEPPEEPFRACTLIWEPWDSCGVISVLSLLYPALSVCGPNVPIFRSTDLTAPGKVDNVIIEFCLSEMSPVLSPAILWGSVDPQDSRFFSIPAPFDIEPIGIHLSIVCVCMRVFLSLYQLQEKFALLFSSVLTGFSPLKAKESIK